MALIPLESNPDVMTKFIHQLGVPLKWSIIDVYSLDPEVLAMVPKPVLALILLYPESEKVHEYNAELEAKIKAEGKEPPSNVFHMQQCVSNACGTVALIHAVLNNLDQIELQDGLFKDFLEKAKDLSFTERGMLLVNTASDIMDTHEQLAQEGQTPVPPKNAPVYHHFVAFVEKDGFLYELDGQKSLPINHGPTTKDKLLENAARVCGQYMARDPDEVGFTTVALVPTE
ncbi:ubiquitin carboxyl-terminal hydrolase [Chelonus insularis]|uniref:ubiquitin carboxyl-terminal hydrolase n=1 Tax=Chelonus insularis TaxID=460826 RepID=UPI00158EB8A0|nr:ubiquitin carboxyl-terminal hydrolase [Chelonus insularis]